MSYFTVILFIYEKNIKRLFSWSITGRFLVYLSSYRCITFVKMMMIRPFLLVPPTMLCLRRKDIIVKCARLWS